jgi:hypothetical protein
MAYKEITTSGPIEWAKIFEGNRDMEGYEGSYVECDGAYTVNQVLSKEEFDKLKASGSQKKPKQNRLLNGELVVNFMRKHKVTNKNGEEIAKAGGAPVVVNADGQPWDMERDGQIGNGSRADITNLVSTFKGQDGKIYSRTTLTKIKITELIPYESPADQEAVGF